MNMALAEHTLTVPSSRCDSWRSLHGFVHLSHSYSLHVALTLGRANCTIEAARHADCVLRSDSILGSALYLLTVACIAMKLHPAQVLTPAACLLAHSMQLCCSQRPALQWQRPPTDCAHLLCSCCRVGVPWPLGLTGQWLSQKRCWEQLCPYYIAEAQTRVQRPGTPILQVEQARVGGVCVGCVAAMKQLQPRHLSLHALQSASSAARDRRGEKVRCTGEQALRA